MDAPESEISPFDDPKYGHLLTRAVIDTIHEPLVVLDKNLRVVAASHSFYKKFDLTHENTYNKLFYELGNGQWNIPGFRILLEEVIPEQKSVRGYEIKHDFPFFGLRIMLVNAHEIRYDNDRKKMLLSIFDITDQRALEADRERLLTQKDLLLKEMQHRIANSLQLIASILLLKAETIDSKESRAHLEDAHQRIMSIATVQRQLEPGGMGESIQIEKYLTALCTGLANSMIGGRKPIRVEVIADPGLVSSDTAISFGLITTELVINAIKHAFPDGRAGTVTVTYDASESGWTLSVGDDGVGQSEVRGVGRPGLGTSIIGALANQLQAIIRTENSATGMKVSLIHART